MSINSILKKEGIEIKSKLDTNQINKIASILSDRICTAFPEHNLSYQDVQSALARLDMYIAKMPADSAVAKYFYKNNSIYFSDKMDLDNLDVLAIHECLHALQEVKNPKGKLLRLGLYDLTTGKGQGINEAAVQLMASKAAGTSSDMVKYYQMDFQTSSPFFYPIETALIAQMIYFTGSYPLFHSTLYSNHIFKNTFIAKANEKVYEKIEANFDLLIHYEDLLSICFSELSSYDENLKNANKIKKLQAKIESVKEMLLKITLSTQNLMIENCFNTEFDLIKDQYSLSTFRQRLYDFNKLLIHTDSYNFYHSYYCEMMSKLEEKSELIKEHGVLTYLNDLQTDLLDLEKDSFGLKFFRRLFNKLKLLFEEAVRDKTNVDD